LATKKERVCYPKKRRKESGKIIQRQEKKESKSQASDCVPGGEVRQKMKGTVGGGE